MDPKELRVGMVGYGETGRRHALAWRALALSCTERAGAERAGTELPGPVRLVALAAGDESAKAAREQAGFEFVFGDPEEVIGHPDVDIIDICAPLAEHASALRSAMAAGKHILCSPPLTAERRDAEEIAALGGRIPGKKQVTSAWRWLPVVVQAHAFLQAGGIGEPQAFRLTCHRALVGAGNAGEEMVAGSTLMDLLPHALDVARALNGEVGEVCAMVEAMLDPQDPENGPTHEVVSSLLRFTNGSTGVLEASRSIAGPAEELRVEITGSEGRVSFDLACPDALTLTSSGRPGAWRIAVPAAPESIGMSGRLAGEVAGLRAFVGAIARDEATDPNFRDGLMAHRIIDAISESAEEETWQPVDLGR